MNQDKKEYNMLDILLFNSILFLSWMYKFSFVELVRFYFYKCWLRFEDILQNIKSIFVKKFWQIRKFYFSENAEYKTGLVNKKFLAY
jgi:hypothetical protein